MQNNFDDIRPYLNSEIQVVFRQLLGNEEVFGRCKCRDADCPDRRLQA